MKKINVSLKCKMVVKRFFVRHPKLHKKLYFIYKILTDFDGREHPISKDKEGKIYYIIRPRTNCIEGLLALFIAVMKEMDYALRSGYIPVVDMKNYKTQYSNGIDNVWEWYFTQPSGVKLEDAYSSNSAVLSGYHWKEKLDERLFSDQIFKDQEYKIKSQRLMFENISFSSVINERVKKEMESIPIESCIGVYLRGTDYVRLKPVGENIQPTVDDVIEKINEFQMKHEETKIFLVTEDNKIYTRIKEKFQNDLYITSFDSFISNYNGTDFLSRSNVFEKDMRSVGEDYLVKMVLLSKCKFLVSSITCGSRVAYVFNGNKYADEYIFDLGKYE